MPFGLARTLAAEFMPALPSPLGQRDTALQSNFIVGFGAPSCAHLGGYKRASYPDRGCKPGKFSPKRTDVVGIFPNDDAITRLAGALLLEQNDERRVQRARYMTLETMAPLSDDLTISLPVAARWSRPHREHGVRRQLHHATEYNPAGTSMCSRNPFRVS